MNSKHSEEFGSDPDSLKPLAVFGLEQVDRHPPITGNAFERLRSSLPISKLRCRDQRPIRADVIEIDVAKDDEPIGVNIWKSAKKNSVDDAENGCRSPDADGQTYDGDYSKERVPTKGPQCR